MNSENEYGDCKRGCCWNPLGVCGRKYQCDHHEANAEAHDARAAVAAAERITKEFGGIAQWIR